MQKLQKYLYIFISLSLIHPVVAQQWQHKSPMPTARKGVASVVLNNQIWVLGGAKMEHSALSEVEVYDPAVDSWDTQLPALLKARDNATAQVWQNSIYVFGGRNGHEMISQVEKFNPDSAGWEIVSQIPTPRFGMASVVVDSTIWLIGGTGHGNTFYDKVDIFYPEENRWEELPAKLNFARGDPMASVINGEVYVFGGYFYGPLANYERFDSTSQAWIVEGDMLYNCASSGLVLEGDKVYLIGGMGQSGMLKSVQVFQPDPPTWSEGAQLNTPRRELIAANVNGKIYAIGGRGSMMNTVYNTVEELDLLVNVATPNQSQDGPVTHLLIDNYPNPFKRGTTLRIILPEKDDLKISIYNLLGRELYRLYEGGLSQGEHSFSISSDIFAGFKMSSGIYFIRLAGNKNFAVRKIQYIK
jgi:N-acetylneuraminic acid mutarotase